MIKLNHTVMGNMILVSNITDLSLHFVPIMNGKMGQYPPKMGNIPPERGKNWGDKKFFLYIHI